MQRFQKFQPPYQPQQRSSFMRFFFRLILLAVAAVGGMAIYNMRQFSTSMTGTGSLGHTIGVARRGGPVQPLSLGNSSGGSAIGSVGGIGQVGSGKGFFGSFGGGGNSGNSAAKSTSLPGNNAYALMDAAASGDEAKVKQYLSQNAPVNSRDENGRTALMFAAWAGQNAICGDLLAGGARIDMTDHEDNTALDYAAGHGLTDTVRYLLEASGSKDSHAYMEYAGIMHAAYTSDATALPQGRLSSVNRLNPEDQSPLHIAAGNGAEALAQALIARGAEVDITNSQKQTPLHWAAWNNQPGAIRVLLAHGANPALRDSAGATPLMLALQHSSNEAAALLQPAGK